jgi:Domain of unknown function (DUF4388)
VYVSLQGTFDTLPVTELFGLLATAAKTGALRLEAGDHEASVFLTGGRCCGVESDELGVPVASEGDLAGRLVDVGFTFARSATGSFRFSDSEQAGYDTEMTTPLELAVIEIRSMVDQWREIEVTIPSLDVRVRLAPVLREAEVVVTAQEWNLLVALDGPPTVRELVARRGEPMLDVCRDLKGLVDRGALELGADLAVRDASAGASADDAVVPADRPAGSDAAPERAYRDPDTVGISLLDPSEPYAPDAEHLVSAQGMAVAAEVDAVAAEAETVAADIVDRMARSRHPVPDVFANVGEASGNAAVDSAVDPATNGSRADVTERVATTTEAEDAAPDRGALLRLFSALKDS